MIVALSPSLSMCHQIGSSRGMQIFGGWCVGGSPPIPSTELVRGLRCALLRCTMTASCLSALCKFESLLGAWKIDALDLKPSGGLVSLSSTPSYMRPQPVDFRSQSDLSVPGMLGKKTDQKMKIPNLSSSVFLRGSVSRVYQLQDRIIMRYLNCPNPENTHSIKKLLTNM